MTEKTLFDENLTLEEAKELIKNGANVNEKDLHGRTPLFFVNDYQIAQLLINHGADVNHERTHLFTPLMVAHKIEIIKVLVQNGADIHKRSSYGHSCLHIYQNKEILEYFLGLGIDINIRMHNGLNLLSSANTIFAKYLVEHGILPSTINDYLRYRYLFRKEQQEAFDIFASITHNNEDFFHMCLAYQEGMKNLDQVEIKEMDIL